ncbi:transglycosylase SLT domain-containing protein [Vibrio splendidus]|uniref:transglycosylase SLT domain-containing protein n=1 Tax=Vibrio splendidus TaxID=29497 RepID=UPI000D3C0F6C|nr:transglycosylase SLT domain-containing protein [Vibrio splendidus]PTO57542.1 murein transglycosylase [Vibrio splendidus]PTP00681.1 murein transglycosylase [Vibrio splendidus]PTP32146.1 murein transglycosylase [Vibrio splendidus]PTP55686.1 murein transglycosylase [Vibrio splendidus]PTP79476.1 murein transglycosylase [Vibrio splendidus]
MYKTITKTGLAIAISAAISFPTLAVSDNQKQQLNNAVVNASQSQEERLKEFHAYVNAYLDEYEQWRDEYTNQLDERRTDLIKTWGEGEVSSQTTQVEYSQGDQVKTAVDYENNTATVSVLVDKDSSAEEIDDLVKGIPVEVAGQVVELSDLKAQDHEVLYSWEKEQQEKDFVIEQTQSQMNELDVQAERLIQSNTGIPDSFIYQRAHNKKLALLSKAQQRIAAQTKLYDEMRAKHGIEVTRLEPQVEVVELVEKVESPKEVVKSEPVAEPKQPSKVVQMTVEDAAEKAPETQAVKPKPVVEVAATPVKPKKVVTYKVKLPENSLKARASKYSSLAEKESKNWEIDAALIMAIMHSESAFRPDAKSHVPAFGLMQVVPTSAGHDVNKQVRNIDAPMKVSDLYQPVINVETGTAYLDILNSKYLRKIENDESRLYCVIAAYNTGAGNVARAFNKDRSTSIGKASKVINKMTPQEVYNHLVAKLPYDETKNYLKKVNSRIALYK